MYSIWVTLTIDPANEAEFLDAIAIDARGSVRDEPGCLGFDVIALDRSAGRWAFYERYVDREAFDQGHLMTAHFRVWEAVQDRVVLPGTLRVDEVETVIDGH